MATGDATDITGRLQRLLPARWFATPAPIRDAILGGIADALAWSYSAVAWARAQTRLLTAYGPLLDVWAYDYLGLTVTRRASETDAAFAPRVKKEVLRERVTNHGMKQALTDLAGTAPVVFEPWNPNNGIAISGGGTLINCAGLSIGNTAQTSSMSLAHPFLFGNTALIGSTAYPNQAIVAYWPPGFVGASGSLGVGSGIGSAGSQDGGGVSTGVGSAGTQVGAGGIVSMAALSGAITTQDIMNAILRTKPSGVTVWTAAIS